MIARRYLVLLVLALVALLAAPASLVGQRPRTDAELDAMVNNIAAQLRCPVCQGVSIGDSPTELAGEMKSVIRQQLVDGRTPEEVKGYFVERYGEWVLLRPQAEGFNLLVYVLPVVMLLVGLFYVFRTVQRWSHVEPSALPLAPVSVGRSASLED